MQKINGMLTQANTENMRSPGHLNTNQQQLSITKYRCKEWPWDDTMNIYFWITSNKRWNG